MKVSVSLLALFVVVALVGLQMAAAAPSKLPTQFLVQVKSSEDPAAVAHSIGMAYGGPVVGSPNVHVFKMIDPATGTALKSVMSSSTHLLNQHAAVSKMLQTHAAIVSFEVDEVINVVPK
jgi:hypothetical protein